MNRHERRKQQKSSGHASPEQIRASFARAVERHRAGDLAGAEELYRRVVEWTPESPEPWNYLGAIALARGDMQKAEQRYAKALALKSDWPEVLNAHGNALHALGRFEEAARDLRRATELDAGFHPAWNSLGISLQRSGDLAESHECFRRACELAPGTASYLHNFGLNWKRQKRFAEARAAFAQALEANAASFESAAQVAHCFRLEGNGDEAARWFAKYLELAPEDSAGAAMFLAAHEGSSKVPAPTPAYVRELFDEYAERFDEHLQHELGYRVPELIESAVREWFEARGRALTLLDLGCGTGLVGALFAPRMRRLVGVDLSSGMLRRARARAIYHELVEAELGEYLRRGRQRFDLIVAADVLNYVGELAPVLEALAPHLDDGGRFVFSVEAGTGSEVRLAQSLRFTHGEQYVREELARAGFEVVELTREVLRLQDQQPVEGLLVVARRA